MRVQYPSDSDASDVSVRVVELISDVLGRPETELTPLTDSVDPDALDDLLSDVDREQEVEVTFRYSGVVVSADNDGRIIVYHPRE